MTKTTSQERLKQISDAPTSHASIVLNGAFNGATIAGLPFAAYEMTHKIKGNATANPLTKTTLFAVIVGTAVGAYFGNEEARKTSAYQSAVSAEIQKLRADIDAQARNRETAAR